jgi:hypothetical protein
MADILAAWAILTAAAIITDALHIRATLTWFCSCSPTPVVRDPDRTRLVGEVDVRQS